LPFEESRGAMRLDTLPVPPVRRMAPFEDIFRGWESELLQVEAGVGRLFSSFVRYEGLNRLLEP
jgi:hypothetical protein